MEVINLKFIYNGWGVLGDGERILFHDSGDKGEQNNFYSWDGNLNKISNQDYFQFKYRNAYDSISTIYGETLTDISYDLYGSIYVSFYQDGVIRKFDIQGVQTNEYEDNFDTLYDIEIQEQSIWLAYPTAHTIKKYGFDPFTEIVSLGDRFDESIFSFPESIVIYDNNLYVCDMGNFRIRRVDLFTFSNY